MYAHSEIEALVRLRRNEKQKSIKKCYDERIKSLPHLGDRTVRANRATRSEGSAMLRIWPRRTLETIVIIVTQAIALIVALAAPDLKQRYVAEASERVQSKSIKL
jgi:hypothetical protein